MPETTAIVAVDGVATAVEVATVAIASITLLARRFWSISPVAARGAVVARIVAWTAAWASVIVISTLGVEVAATVVFARAHTAVAWGAAWHTARTATIAGRAEVAARVVVLTAFHFHRTASSVAAEVVIAAKHAAIAS